MMSRLAMVALAAASLAAMGCSPAATATARTTSPPAEASITLRNRDFIAEAPAGFTATEMVGPDFSVWTIARSGRAYVGVYAGNFPQVGGSGRPVPAGQRLVTIGPAGHESYLHIWTHDLPPAEAAVARRIADSVRAPPQASALP